MFIQLYLQYQTRKKRTIMARKINLETKVSDLITKYPQTKEVFNRYGLDYSDTIPQKIETFAKEKNIESDELIASLKKAMAVKKPKTKELKNWDKESLTNIINNLENSHHAFLWRTMPTTDILLNMVLNKLKTDPKGKKHKDFVIGLKNIFGQLQDLLEKHLCTEEDVVFSYIKNNEIKLKKKIKVEPKEDLEIIMKHLYDEHVATNKIMTKMRNFTYEYKIPEYMPQTFQKIYANLKAIENDLREHTYIEDEILFPRVQKFLD